MLMMIEDILDNGEDDDSSIKMNYKMTIENDILLIDLM